MVDRFGRKKLLMTSCATTSVSIASLGIYFYFNDSGLDTHRDYYKARKLVKNFRLEYDR